MDLSARKLNLISYLTQIQDEVFFDNIESYILKKLSKENSVEFTPFSVDELINRVEKSEKDFKNGKIKSQEDLEKLSENW